LVASSPVDHRSWHFWHQYFRLRPNGHIYVHKKSSVRQNFGTRT